MSGKMISPDLSPQLVDESPETANLPVTQDLKPGYVFSLLIVALTAGASIAGLLYPNDIYPTEELRQSFVANDLINLVIGLPILLGSMWLARRGKLIGLLFWPGAIFYGLYNYLVYLFAMPFNVMFLLYLMIVTLSIYATIGLVANIKGKEVQRRLIGRVPERFAGGVLFGFGFLFIVRALAVMAQALINQSPIARPELGLLVADFIFSAAFVIGGLLLWRRQPLGYVGGTGLLFQTSMLFVGLVIILIMKPLLTEAPFVLTDIVIVFLMGLICFIPFTLFVRGVVKS